MRLALIYGGEGYEREVSLLGFRHLFPILNDIFDLFPIHINTDGHWIYKNTRVFPTDGGFYSIEREKLYPVDCAFPLLHGNYGEDGIIQGALSVAKIPYIGSPSTVGAVCRDKTVVKAVAESIGIPTLPYRLIGRAERPDVPCFIKPTGLGSSIGASAVRGEEELASALERAFAVSERVMAEPLLEEKRELECGYFSAKGKEIFTNPGEILSCGFYDYKKKYEGGTKINVRADLDESLTRRIKDYAKSLAHALGVRQIARVDFFLSEGELYFNEINTMPGFTRESLYHKMLSLEGISLREMIISLAEDAYAGRA